MSIPAQTGRAWVLGDGIDTDVLAPGHLLKLSPEDLAKHCLETIAPNFARSVRPGDIVVAGKSFGIGSSREQAAVSLKELGVAAILATSFARIFWRNALNLGLPALIFPNAKEIEHGDAIMVDILTGSVQNLTSGKKYTLQPLSQHLSEIIAEGGLMPYLKRRYGTGV